MPKHINDLLSQAQGGWCETQTIEHMPPPSGEVEFSGVARLRTMVEWIAERQGDRLMEGEAP